ncbi:MAG: FAD-dependent monooxygenase [Neisseria sp.]|uniref:FAD-dependent monooxygenase n=1 Tax=Neisseria sp. TaxID=192066 RepID=UPI0026DD81B9|nr:FAD-dependent monooxygenase [Neisseria sp.]MDO4642148.1 FAD-dependent monooxygenase [Neisseria sp.]
MVSIPLHTQIAIVGAGPVGALAAIELARQGKQVLLIEARPAHIALRDQRTLALSFNSIRCFKQAGISLPETQMTKINAVHISQPAHFRRTLLRATDMNMPYLGMTCDYAALIGACETALNQPNLSVLWQTSLTNIKSLNHFAELEIQHNGQTHSITADWVILAEGGALAEKLPGIRRHSHDYQQSALVATLSFEQTNNGTAYERFSTGGPMALLPYRDAYRLVWTRSPQEAEKLAAASFSAFAAEFEQTFGKRLGRLTSYENAAVFPLQLKQLNKVYSGRVICIGNAAQTMHPVAAQGLNLGVRDAVALAACFATPHSLTNSRLAQQYAASRRLDAHATVGFTHSLVTVFDQPNMLLQLGRGTVMNALDSVPALRKKFTEHLIFGL